MNSQSLMCDLWRPISLLALFIRDMSCSHPWERMTGRRVQRISPDFRHMLLWSCGVQQDRAYHTCALKLCLSIDLRMIHCSAVTLVIAGP